MARLTSATSIKLPHESADLEIEFIHGGHKVVSVARKDPGLFVLRQQVRTAYPIELIQHIFTIKGPSYSCDEIARDEDPAYVQTSLASDLFAYFAPEDFI